MALELVVGSMFSGKSEELIRRVKRALIARRSVQVFKPALDDRYGTEVVRSHDGDTVVAIPVKSASEILGRTAPDTSVIAIDEVQFFGPEIVDVCRRLIAEGRRVVCAGLDLDFRGEPFGPVPQLLALAEHVDKLTAICVVCGETATRTQRIVDGVPAYYEDELVLVGGATESYDRPASEASTGRVANEPERRVSYEARCRACHEVPHREAPA